ncbi:MAG: 23S rRNA (guanosine-2'-O-) -methyltransferase rlmB (EC [uncultured Campylobacterales bacterium]|uniref:23S rRNA (Guanosine-2'-O-) -methyltransferase rlmB (EC) n=1 Tax=uncultured Campylobacterales bacterium TaxID=352960 RepID=A0A6S6SV89_9BACT|nr:MAG: 23S rRNA (guanosine-2'-O-) -methyltransferase rlmB (EC [uncultured Campylobacterales bacterium]
MTVFGKQIFMYTVDKFPERIKSVYLSKEIDKKLFGKITRLNVPIVKLDNKKAQAMSKGGNHQGYFLEIEPIIEVPLDTKAPLVLVLYKVTDVGNIGAIVRSAYAFGVSQIVITGISAMNLGAIVRTSSGALMDMPICIYEDSFALMNELKISEYDILGLDMGGENIGNMKLKDTKRAIIVGSEAEGVPQKFLKKCTSVVSIPMKRKFDSLNVSVATGIILQRIVND